MSKTKRKIITKTVVRKELIEKEKQFFYSKGAQDAFHTILMQHADLIQLKELCTEYEKTFQTLHPARNWHLYRNQVPTDGTSGKPPNSNNQEISRQADRNDSDGASQIKSPETVSVPEPEAPATTTEQAPSA